MLCNKTAEQGMDGSLRNILQNYFYLMTHTTLPLSAALVQRLFS